MTWDGPPGASRPVFPLHRVRLPWCILPGRSFRGMLLLGFPVACLFFLLC